MGTAVWLGSWGSVLTARGRGSLLVGVVLLGLGLWWRYPVVAGLGGLLISLVVAELVAVLTTRDIAVNRDVAPDVVIRNEPCEGRLTLQGRRRRGLVRIDAGDQVDGTLVPITLPETRTSTSTVRYAIPTPRRGLVPIGPVQLRHYGLAGMAERSTEAGEVDRVRVLPRRIPLDGMLPGRRQAVTGGDDSLELGGTDLIGLHEYVLGEDLRRLHWATSARIGRLMVRDDAEPSEPHVCVVLDDRAASYPDRDSGAEQFEEAVELASALCRVAVSAGYPTRFRDTSGRDEIVIPGSATRQLRREAQELEWLLAEIALVQEPELALGGSVGLDIVVVVTGAAADQRELALSIGDAATQVVAVVDPAPTVTAAQEAGMLVLRGGGSASLSALWQAAVEQ